jgi:ParB family chromosome partitioning protein
MSRDILLNLIDPDPGQPRKHFDQAALDELAQSIKANGLAVPILLRPHNDRFVIVHGERRYRAAVSLEWETIAADVRDIAPEDARWLALVENVQRDDLSPIEEAQAYQDGLSDGLTQKALGERIGKTQSYIAQKLRLLKLPPPIQFYLNRKAISEGHARQLMRLKRVFGGIETYHDH